MTNSAPQTNDDLPKLRARVVEVEQRNAELEKQVAHLTKMLFARKSERRAIDAHPQLPFRMAGSRLCLRRCLRTARTQRSVAGNCSGDCAPGCGSRMAVASDAVVGGAIRGRNC